MAMTRGQHLIGTVLGSCVLERLLGYGGSSAVFLGKQQSTQQQVAVKVFLPRSNMDAQMRRDYYRRFLREAEAARQLDHPNILPIYSYGEQDGLPYIIMPYMSGGTLSEYMAKRGPLALDEALWHLEQIASALDYAHEHGCVHCDVKPANILLDGDSRILLADFGIARLASSVDGEKKFTTSSEALMGTPDYISPEQALGQSLDGRSDIYSLAVLLFYLLTKRLPFMADSTIAVALLHIHEVPPSLRLLRADIPPAIDSVVHRALAKKPAERFPTPTAFSTAFAQAINPAQPYESKHHAENDTVLMESEQEHAFVTPPTVVQVKSLSQPSKRFFSTPRLILVAALLLILIGTMATTTIMIAQHASRSTTPHVPILPTSLSSHMNDANLDALTNKSSWPPVSSSFFYDGEQQQQYHVLNKSDKDVAVALYNDHKYSNVVLTMTMKQIRSAHDDAADYYGVIFRSSTDQLHYYVFAIMSSGSAGYEFLRYDAGTWKHLAEGPIFSILTGVGKSNTITVKAHGNTFTFFINKKQVNNPITDTSKSVLSSGEVGLYVEQDAEVAFSHLYIDIPK